MGTIENGKECETCHQDVWCCPGHFGHIELNEPIIHPLFYKQVASFLKCFCIKCFRLLLSRDQIYLNSLNRFKGSNRFDKVIEKLEKIDMCSHCSHPQPEIKYSPTDNSISMVCKQKGQDKLVIVLTVEEIKKTFDNVIDSDVELLGFDPEMVHPKNYIMVVFPVLPQCFLENTLVLTDKGYKYIKDVEMTDKLYTHMGKYQKIKEIFVSDYNQTIININVSYHPNVIECTPEHPFYVKKIVSSYIFNKVDGKYEIIKNVGEPEWVESKNLTSNYYIGMKRNNNDIIPEFTFEKGIETITKILDRKEEWFLIGYFLGCGLVDFNYEGKFYIYFEFSDERRIIELLEGLEITFRYKRQYRNSVCNILECHNFILWNIFKELGHLEYNNKKIPVWIHDAPIEYIQQFLDGYYIAEFYQHKTLSKDVAFSLQLLYIKMGIVTNISVIKEGVAEDISYQISFEEEKDTYLLEEEYIWFKIFDVEEIAYLDNMKVYNFEVEEDNSYTVENLISHNCCRPFVIADGNTCDDDLSNQIVEIIKANNHLAEEDTDTKSDSKHQKYLQSLKFRISTFYNNSAGKAKHTTSGRPIRGLKERLTGKDGQIRTNLMGKRVDQSGRTVIGGDPTLKLGELAVPVEMAKILTVPVQITAFNIVMMTELVNDGKANFVLKNGGATRINLKSALFYRGTRLMHGDIIVRGRREIVVNNGNDTLEPGDLLKRNGEFVDDLKYPGKKRYHLTIGDIVERQLHDGDVVILNRQPTLHKASMMAMDVVIRPYKTLRMNLAICKPFNADFDGDEMNIHVAQSLEARAELRGLSGAKHNIISAQDGKPNMAIVQDSLLGAYRMTLGFQKVRKDQFFNISLKIEMSIGETTAKIKHISRILRQKNKKSSPYHGKGLISLILPEDLNYETHNNADPDEPIIKIYRGVLYEGTINKSIIGSAHNSLIQIMDKEYGPDAAAKFIDGVQFITNNWLLISGFSVGVGDCLIQGESKEEEIRDEIQKCFIEAEGIKTTTSHPIIRELRISAVLNKAKDIGLRIAKDALDPKNNFLSTVNSGSKGDFFNIAQITGLLGQQNLQGQRVVPALNHGKRSLPHYPFGELPVELEYESKGFIASSFIKGLNPKQFYFHAMSGREGICDTAMGTATSGYMQRRIVKLTEDIKSQYDGTVRDAIGKTYQLSYGGDGLDPVHTVKVNGAHEVCDVTRMVSRLNMKHELALKPEEEEELSDSDDE